VADPIIRSIIERSLFSSYSLTQVSFATFSAREFMFDGLDDFEEQISVPWAPSVSEKQIRATLSVLEREPVERRLDELFKELRLPFAHIHAPPSQEGRGSILMHLLRDILAHQQFAPTVLMQEVEQRRLSDAIEEDRILRAEFGSVKVSSTVAGIVSLMFAAGPRVAVEAQDTLQALLRQDIPFSLSPEIRSDTLRSVIQEARKFAVLPLYAGSFGAATAVSSGQYVTAIEMAAAGGGATIIVAGAAAVADRLLAILARR
jgi:hypothetical protein